jgi:hypothetical protein
MPAFRRFLRKVLEDETRLHAAIAPSVCQKTHEKNLKKAGKIVKINDLRGLLWKNRINRERRKIPETGGLLLRKLSHRSPISRLKKSLGRDLGHLAQVRRPFWLPPLHDRKLGWQSGRRRTRARQPLQENG